MRVPRETARMPVETEDLRKEIERLAPWHHKVEVRPGIWTDANVAPTAAAAALGTPSLIEPDRHFRALVQELFPNGFEGRSMLDCACNGGGYLVAAARLGAGRSFGFDVREHWMAQARFLAEHLPDHRIELRTCDISQLPALGLEPFDFTLFKGLFYHLPDPIAGLRIAADLTREILVVNTAAAARRSDSLVLTPESRELAMSGVHGLAWLPGSEKVLREILAWCGFPHARLVWEIRLPAGNRRMELVAARDPAALAHFDARRPPRSTGLWRRIRRRIGGRR